MGGAAAAIEDRVEALLWPFVQQVLDTWALPGLAVCVVHDRDRVMARGFGTRDRSTGEPVTPDTPFHLASISKSFVATAVMQLVEAGELDLGGALTTYLPDLPWADPRAGDITLVDVLSHRSGIGDVSDYGWHQPELDDGALGRFANQVAGWPLERDPGSAYAYSNAAYEVLGHLLAVVSGRTFEDHLRDRVLRPAGMATSTFLPAEVPQGLGARPHLGLPSRVLDGAYPYTRQHAPSSSLHAGAAELGTWMVAHLAGGAGLLSPQAHAAMWRPRGPSGGVWQAETALGWFWGTCRGLPVVNHSGSDPGFETHLALWPDLGLGVVVLADSNTAPIMQLAEAAVDVLLGRTPPDPPPPPAAVPLGPVLHRYGVPAAVEAHRKLVADDPRFADAEHDGLEDAVWGAVEMHRTDVARPVLDLWRRLRPGSAAMWSTSAWAHEVDGRPADAVEHARRALGLDPDDEEAAALLRRLSADP